ncbi:hypothetical protein, partial [Pseudomonas sp. Kh14]|uniref:hypothetical protein n=1 Tax=Pseudomonas sp. Kh14 TaxID=2093745 RepID=UPI001C499DBC
MTQEQDEDRVAGTASASLATLADPASAAVAASKKRGICAISGQETARKNLVEVGTLRPALADHIRSDFPDMPDHAL